MTAGSLFRRPVAAALLAGFVLPALATAAGPGTPNIPDIDIPDVPGQQTARFKVVVEGNALAKKDERWTSPDPTQCSVDITSHLEEKTVYLRGRGVLMEFTRLAAAPGAPVLIQRAGRIGDSSLAVQATTTRTVSGTARRFGSVPEACPPVTEDLATSPDCGKPEVNTTKLSLLYQNRLLRLKGNTLGNPDGFGCGASTVRGGMDSLHFSWTHNVPAPLAPAALSPAAIFGTRRVLVVTMISTPRVRGPETISQGNLNGTVTESGRNRATVRLIRVP